jgi:CrcB protein
MPSDQMRSVLLIAIFGALGVLTRFAIVHWISPHRNLELPPHFPWATFMINLVGSLFIGFLYALQNSKGVFSEAISTAITVGFLGGFTTFSSFSLETFQLFSAGRYLFAGTYFIVSPLLGFVFAYVGVVLGQRI